nr:DnaJ sub C member 3 [Polyrhizophydium stewartii]
MRLSWLVPALLAVVRAASVTEHMDAARALMSSGQHFKALDQFEAAIEMDPNNHMLYFKRAAAYLTLGKYPQALADFTKVLELKPQHTQARIQKARILLMSGAIDEAARECKLIDPSTAAADQEASKLIASVNESVELDLLASKLLKAKDCAAAIEPLTTLISLTPLSFDRRLARADCLLELGDKEGAISDFKRCVKIKPDSISLYIKLADLHLSLGEVSDSLSNSKECLRLDPDQRECKKQFRRTKRIEKALNTMESNAARGRWRDTLDILFGDQDIMAEVEGIGAASLKTKTYAYACRGYGATKKDVEAIDWCTKALDLDGNDLEVLLARAQAFTNKADYKEAMGDYQRAHEQNRQDPRSSEGYNRAQKLLKRAGMKDYYKILGVPRDASEREIKKAFRKKAQEWHPDKYSGTLAKEEVEKKMSEINQAYEVLSNPELRERFDNGDDPNDPNQGGHSGGHPFGGHPFFMQSGGFGGGFPGGGFQFTGGNFKFQF